MKSRSTVLVSTASEIADQAMLTSTGHSRSSKPASVNR
jgi:hypothetical protein